MLRKIEVVFDEKVPNGCRVDVFFDGDDRRERPLAAKVHKLVAEALFDMPDLASQETRLGCESGVYLGSMAPELLWSEE